jgi:hypothetical protein
MKKDYNVVYRREPGTPLTESQLGQLKALEGRPIDTSDIPELPASAWKDKVRGRVLPAGEAGGEPAAGCGCDCVAEEGWRRVSDAGEPDAAGADAGGVGGAGESGSCVARMPTHRMRQR